MHDEAEEFSARVEAVLARFFRQNAVAPPRAPTLRDFGARLYELVAERGLPEPLDVADQGRPGGIPETECAGLVARVLVGTNEPLLAEAARQLVKACFYPEFKTCRDSFREVSPDGVCRRQLLERALGRISGSHCVDCPHWIALAAEPHGEFMASQWHGDAAEFRAHQAEFLPEDFRALRRGLHAAARRSRGGESLFRT